MQPKRNRTAWIASATALSALVLWDVSGLDMALARAMGGALGFPLRDQWFLDAVMHSGAKYVAWVGVLALCALVPWPVGAFARLPLARRLQLPATVLLSTGFVALLKANSSTSCPWDLQAFGGVAQHLSHWAGWLQGDGGVGRCFPAGHATTGFAFAGGYFAWRHHAPAMARAWLALAIAAGFVLGIGQQLRGAHFLSHTLWTGWICWTTAFLTDALFAEAPPPRQLEATP